MNSTETVTARPDKTVVWKRGLLMLVFVFAFGVGQTLLYFMALVQFIWLLSTGEPNGRLARFGKSHSLWLASVGQFLICATEDKPFPWADWPAAD